MNSLRDIPFRSFYRPYDRPLEAFYIPALKASASYDRSAGFFRSSALAAAASGVAHLIQNGGKMRLLVGADLEPSDVEAIRKGEEIGKNLERRLLEEFQDPADALVKKRLEVLAWMVATDMLQIKVVLPVDASGFPIPGNLAQDYYHTKKGIFSDEEGNRVAFVGSVNESAQAWKYNFEEFAVYLSWEGDREQSALDMVQHSFDELWEDQNDSWKAIEVPEAVRERLIRFRPREAPTEDPVVKERREQEAREKQRRARVATPKERVVFQFLRDAPRLVASADLGAATSAVLPWPHQLRIAREVLSRFPEGSLLCDEVGLGKTIEAGLVIRSLLITGRIERLLILTPKSVLKQWQEELYEKFGLDIPRFDAGQVLNVRGEVIQETQNPWSTQDRLLASSQLAKRRERSPDLETAEPWDLLLIDEAHHARRRDFRDPRYRPNRLLVLLENLRDKVGALLLVTATPMQIHPVELWDLLVQLGMGGVWAADEEHFLRYFTELRKPFKRVDWDFVLDLVKEELDLGQQIDPEFAAETRRELGAAIAKEVLDLPLHAKPRRVRSLPDAAHPYLFEFASSHTPLRPYLFRSTRALLRRYIEAGILEGNIPRRRPEVERVGFNAQEEALYHRVDEYITNFYHKYEAERRGLGFVMTVYRRRLTSSFYALRISLERRLRFLRGEIGIEDSLAEEDLEQEALRIDIDEDALGDADKARFAEELAYLESFIQDVRAIGPSESKLESLKAKLNQIFLARDKVIIFSQYTDTMDFLRDHLMEVYGMQVACYSGRGGEIWNGIAWVPASKEYVKTRFAEGGLRILVCTEAASEGINLQTCGVLINYDMPWNPMRVEQRIGRIDRIGQKFEDIWIVNYYYEGTIEDRVYMRLRDRIAWFEVVVGALQPILAEVGEATRRLAMVPEEAREAELEKVMREIDRRIEILKVEGLDLDQFIEKGMESLGLDSPVSMHDLEHWLAESQATSSLLERSLAIKGAYSLVVEGPNPEVTFNYKVFDEHPDTVQFLTYGNPLLDQVLARVPKPEGADLGSLIRIEDVDRGRVAWYWEANGRPAMISTLTDLVIGIDSGVPISASIRDEAEQLFRSVLTDLMEKETVSSDMRTKRRERMIQARGISLLKKAAYVEIALGRQKDMFEEGMYPTAFTDGSIKNLNRHGYPWTALLALCSSESLEISEDDAYFISISNKNTTELKAIMQNLAAQARALLEMLRKAKDE